MMEWRRSCTEVSTPSFLRHILELPRLWKLSVPLSGRTAFSLLRFHIQVRILVICLCLADKTLVCLSDRQFVAGAVLQWAHGVLPYLADRGEHGQAVAFQIAQVLVGRHERAGMIGRGEDVLSCKGYAAVQVEQGQNGRHEVNLRTEFPHLARPYDFRGIDKAWDVVAVDGQRCLSRTGGTVVGNDDEHRVPEPDFPLRLGDESADGIVGVFHGSLPGVGGAVHLYPSGGVGVGAVIAGRHDLCEERMSRPMVGIEHLQAFPEYILVAHTPDVGESHLVVRDGFPVDDLIAVMAEEVAHVVKVAVAAVDELRA